jgi:hypothetical protein
MEKILHGAVLTLLLQLLSTCGLERSQTITTILTLVLVVNVCIILKLFGAIRFVLVVLRWSVTMVVAPLLVVTMIHLATIGVRDLMVLVLLKFHWASTTMALITSRDEQSHMKNKWISDKSVYFHMQRYIVICQHHL